MVLFRGASVTSPGPVLTVSELAATVLALSLVGGVFGALLFHLAADIVSLFVSWLRRRYSIRED